MLSPLEKLPPLESQNSQDPDFGEGLDLSKRICQLEPALLTREKFGPCATVTDGETLHNPVLTLNIAADNSPEREDSHFVGISPFLTALLKSRISEDLCSRNSSTTPRSS
jgi:hypothetical protein